ncbi:MAG: carbohydrate binding family 9 domain-containing protein [Holophagales bacterium]|nr:carbohydrate binding family 9 domain-containing protein [Holophagales bacterium]
MSWTHRATRPGPTSKSCASERSAVYGPAVILSCWILGLGFLSDQPAARGESWPTDGEAPTSAARGAVGEDSPVEKENPARATYRIPRFDGAGIRVDGELSEQAWEQALSIPLPYEWFPGDGVAPPVETEALLFFDRGHFYIAFRAQDPEPERIRAHLMDRDAIDTFVQDDHVLFTLDTFDDQRRGFQFRVNPYGVQADAIFSAIDGVEDFSWDIVWQSAARIGATGWVAEVAIPFNQLRFPKRASSQAWGIDLGRSYPRNVRHRIAANIQDRDNNCLLCQVPRIEGLEGLEPGLNLELAPTLTVDRTDSATTFGGPLESGDEDTEAGLSVRWSPSPSLTLNGTVNPDFSQVEADAAQLDVNERFALFFPEKRPFFLEGVDFFSTQIPVVFTRTVVDPDWGVKLTGKQGASAFGLFTAMDARNSLVIPSNTSSSFASVDDEVLATVGRWRRDVGEASTVGVLYSGREGDEYHNRLAGLDGFLRFDEKNTLQVQALFSDTHYPTELARAFGQDEESFGGHAFEGFYVYDSRDWSGSLGYRDFGEGFRADSGFVPRVGFETWRGELTRFFWGEEDDPYTRIDLGGLVIHTRDHTGRLSDEVVEATARLLGPHQSELEVRATLQDQISGDVLFENLEQATVSFEMQPTGDFRFSLFAFVGEDVDFANSRRADALQTQVEAELKIGDHLNLQADLAVEELEVGGERLFEATLAQSTLVYQFDTRMFVRGIFQYLDLDFTPELYLVQAPVDQEQLFGQLLFSYKINPQTVLFLGYTETRQGFAGSSLEPSDRTFFFKVGYAWIR